MTLPNERSRSVRYAREFLRDLLDPKKTPRIPRETRRRAYAVLRHFPSDLDIEYAADGAPEHFALIEREDYDFPRSTPPSKSARKKVR